MADQGFKPMSTWQQNPGSFRKDVVCHMAYSALYLKKLGLCYHIESMSTLKIFQSSPASYYKSIDEFTLQFCDYVLYVLQRKENDRQLLRKFSNLDY